MVCATPVFREIKNKYPLSRVVLVLNLKVKGIVKNNKNIDEIIEIPDGSIKSIKGFIRKVSGYNFYLSVAIVPGTLNYIIPFLLGVPVRSGATEKEYGFFYKILASIILNFKKEFKFNYLSVKHYLDLFDPINIDKNNLKKKAFYKEEAKSNVLGLFINFFNHKKVIFSVSSGNKMKQWPIDRFVELIFRISKHYSFIPVLISGPDDKDLNKMVLSDLKDKGVQNIILLEDLSLEDLPAGLSFLDYFVSVDLGVLYISNALDIPVLDIAGPCNIYDQMPIYEKCEVVYVKDLSGWPYSSILKTATYLSEKQKESIYGITVDMVCDAFANLVKKYE